MANIFTRKALSDIMANDGLTPEQRTEQVMSLYGRALDDGYISRSAAQTAQETALNNAKAEWEKSIPKPNVKESDEYKALQGEYAAYKTMQSARNSEDFREVKPKFFETVYGMVQHGDGAKPVKEQLESIKADYEEYFTPKAEPPKPTFGAPTQGSMPKGDEGAEAQFLKAWGLTPKK